MVDLLFSHALTVSHSVILLLSVNLFLSLLPVPDPTLSPPTNFPNATTAGNNLLAQELLMCGLLSISDQYLPVQQLASHLLQLLILSLVHLPVQLVSHHLFLLILLVHLLKHQLSATQASSDWPTPHTYRSLTTHILTSVDHKCVLMEHFSVLVVVLIRMLPGHSVTIDLDPILVNLIDNSSHTCI